MKVLASTLAASQIRKVPQNILGVSEPDPSWFGNPANPKNNNNWSNENWLKSRFHFSFAEYSNAANQQFGSLRVLNDDLVQPQRGFGSHPHRDAEICTYVVNGNLTHQDNMGTKETLTRGAIQFMTAGSGVVHSEHNLDATAPLRFIQMWFTTRQRGLKPNYGSATLDTEARHNQWAHMVSDVRSSEDVPIKINQDADIFVTELDAGNNVTLDLSSDRQAYLVCLEGDAQLSMKVGDQCGSDSVAVTRHDAAELFGPGVVTMVAGETGAHLLVVRVAYTGAGRSDLQ